MSKSGFGFSIADDYTPNWDNPNYFPQLEDGFKRLNPKVFRLQIVWNAMEGGTDANALKRKKWRERTHGMIAKARSKGVEQIILSLRGNYPDNVGADGYFASSSAYYAKVKPLVQEFADEVDVWSPANEPNAKWRPDNAPGGGQALSAEYAAAYYLRMRELVEAYDDSSALVTSPDFLDSPGFKAYAEDYRSYIPPGVPKWGNAAAFHPYRGVEQSASGGIWTTNDFASVLPSSEFPIWITEVGSRVDKFGFTGQNQQVDWIVKTLGQHSNVTRISYYDMLDRPITWDSALLNEDKSPRPAWNIWCAAAHGGNAAHADCLFPADRVGVFQPSDGHWWLTNWIMGTPPNHYSFYYGSSNHLPVAGDWDGDGKDSVGVFQASIGHWWLTNSTSGLAPNHYSFYYGSSNHLPVAGDWDGDGKDSIGVFQPSGGHWWLSNATSGSPPNHYYANFGTSGDLPVAGDWDGDGKDSIGVFRPSTAMWYLRNSNSSGGSDYIANYGASTHKPVVGDWNGDGKESIGVFQQSGGHWWMTNAVSGSPANNYDFFYGSSTHLPVAGDWDG